MDANKILSADILDIIFDGKNKQYGAYDLRKTYNKRILTALVGTVIICFLVFFITFLANNLKKEKKTEIIVQDVNLEDLKKKDEKKAEPPPPPPPPKQDPP